MGPVHTAIGKSSTFCRTERKAEKLLLHFRKQIIASLLSMRKKKSQEKGEASQRRQKKVNKNVPCNIGHASKPPYQIQFRIYVSECRHQKDILYVYSRIHNSRM